jgi:hypothetical protein
LRLCFIVGQLPFQFCLTHNAQPLLARLSAV